LILSKNDIKEAELRLKNANEKLKDYEIVAPFDGVIRKTEISFGDTIKTDTDKSIFIENPNLVQIDLELDQVDIVNATK
jgi:multidrug resistance efflux pump